MDITEEVITHLKNNIKTKIGISSIDGVGVIAIRDIQKDEEVFPIWNYDTGIYLIPNDRLDNITNDGIALRDIKTGEEILEWYHKNINSDMYI